MILIVAQSGKVFNMHRLYALADNETIVVEYMKLTAPTLGFYYQDETCHPIIGLDYSLHSHYRLHHCVMAEKLGHHFTSASTKISKRHHSTQARLTIDKIEYKALPTIWCRKMICWT